MERYALRVSSAVHRATMKAEWLKEHLVGVGAMLPFSFVFDGRTSDKLLPGWTRTTRTMPLDAACTQHTSTWSDPKGGLEVRCVAVDYADHPAVEWTVYFRNNKSAKDTPILENIQGLDAWFDCGEKGEFVLPIFYSTLLQLSL